MLSEIPLIKKINVNNPIVDIDGDEMTRVIWKMIREKIINKFLDVNLIYFDLSLENRIKTNDEITHEAIKSIKKHRVAIKCATINPDKTYPERNKISMGNMLISPNMSIRTELNGIILREPIIINNIPKIIQNWKKPILIARHAYGDLWEASEVEEKKIKKAYLTIETEEGEKKYLIHDFLGNSGVLLGCFNTDESIENFAKFCFEKGIERKLSVYLSTKNTILKTYDEKYFSIFTNIFHKFYLQKFDELEIIFEHKLIDDMVAFALKSEGGFIWACKNHDGDVQSNFVVQGFGSLGLMTSFIYSKNGLLCEAGHGTITRHYMDHLKGLETSSNSIPALFAWSRTLRERATIDDNQELLIFVDKLEASIRETLENNFFTRDLCCLVYKNNNPDRCLYLNTEQFIDKVSDRLLNKFN